MSLHMLKLSVGTEDVDGLARWQARQKRPSHITRMFPRRAEDILAGGSIYWVIRGVILCRQRILALEPVESATGRRCAIRLDSELVRTEPRARRAFQGWRYLEPKDAPPDLIQGLREEALPYEMESALSEFGVLRP